MRVNNVNQILVLFFVLFLLTVPVYSQLRFEEKAVKVDEKEKKLCQKEVEVIDVLSLKRDSVCSGYNVLYFDEKGRVRKITGDLGSFNIIGNDAGEFFNISAYFNQAGNLVYITNDSGNNCERTLWYYYLDKKGRVADFQYEKDCDCCESDDPSLPEFPHIGNKLNADYWMPLFCCSLSLGDFFYADTLLKAIREKKEY